MSRLNVAAAQHQQQQRHRLLGKWALLLAGGALLLYLCRGTRDAWASDAQFSELKARELQYWNAWLREKGHEYWQRMTSRELEDDIKALIPSAFLQEQYQTIRVLDAGAGPVTQLGSVWPGRDLELHACDVLADQYEQLLDKYDLDPPVRTASADIERLERTYPRNHFHFVLARDVIDQTMDPKRALRGLLAVLKPRGNLLIVQDRSTATRRTHINALWHVREIEGHPMLVQDARAVNLTACAQQYGATVTLVRKGSTMFIRAVKRRVR